MKQYLNPVRAVLLSAGLAAALSAVGCDSGGGGDAAQGGSLSNTGFSAQSLYHGPAPRPGPDILYAPPAEAPQMENAGVWQAPPILVSGASAYRDGEYLYQDYLYDDHGAYGTLPDVTDPRSGIPHNPTGGNLFSMPGGTYTYPTAKVYANNAADLVEFRVKPLADATAFRVTLNTLLDPQQVAFTIALGNSDAAQQFPHGANVSAPAQYFLTVHGDDAEFIDAATGKPTAAQPSVQVDMRRRQFDIRLPRAAFDPGRSTVRMAMGVGLWTPGGGYLTPGPTASASQPGGSGILTSPPAFFNVAFRFNEPQPTITNPLGDILQTAWWRDRNQADALANNSISPFFTDVDFAKLSDGVNDDMAGQPQGVPQTGAMDRILASHFETAQGANYKITCGGADGCLGELRSRLQPYAIYVPKKPMPAGGYGLTLLLHSLAGNYNQYAGSRNQRQYGERGSGHIVITPSGRGPDGWYVEYAGADTFEVWADVARHYLLNPAHTAVTGYSMGGYGTFRFATRYPDLFGKAQTTVGPPAIGISVPPIVPPTDGQASDTMPQLESLRNIPIQMWVMVTDELVPYPGPVAQANRLDTLGYRYEFDSFTPGEHLTFAVNDQFAPAAAFLGDSTVDRNPAHVSFAVNPSMDFPDVGMVGDHAYWLSGIRVRKEDKRGFIDARSQGFGVGDAPAGTTQTGVEILTGGTLPALAYTQQSKQWGDVPAAPSADKLVLNARNIAALTVHPQRAQLDCDAELKVTSDGPINITLAGCDGSQHFGGNQ